MFQRKLIGRVAVASFIGTTIEFFDFYAYGLAAALFGHFGDRVGRKTILIVSLLLMGGSTFLVGLLPGYATWGILAPGGPGRPAVRPGDRAGW